jgi:hypothetical protein
MGGMQQTRTLSLPAPIPVTVSPDPNKVEPRSNHDNRRARPLDHLNLSILPEPGQPVRGTSNMSDRWAVDMILGTGESVQASRPI